jgi:hypothetical protein
LIAHRLLEKRPVMLLRHQLRTLRLAFIASALDSDAGV